MIANRPVMVAVGGDSGTGKTTLVSGLYRIFGPERITNICLDDYHKLDRAARKRLGAMSGSAGSFPPARTGAGAGPSLV